MKIRQILGEIIVYYYITKENRPDIFNLKEINLIYINKI
jgi:hypothetical protein